MIRLRLSLCLLGLGLGCGEEAPEPPSARSGSLPAGAVAKVGDALIHKETVARIAGAAHVAASEARDRAVFDALFASEAAQRLEAPLRSVVERGAIGRALLEHLLREAELRGPPTDDEIAALTRERWVELDRPASARVTHAVVLFGKAGDPSRARVVAEQLAAAVRGITDPEAFTTAAKAVASGDFDLRVEHLPPMTPDGRAFSLHGLQLRGARQFDATFAQAANELVSPGDQSPLVETRFGYHVILLEEKVPESRVSLEDRRRVLAQDVFARRAGQLRRALMDEMATKVPVEIARDFAARTEGLGGS